MNVAGTRSTFAPQSGDFVFKTANDEQGILRVPRSVLSRNAIGRHLVVTYRSTGSEQSRRPSRAAAPHCRCEPGGYSIDFCQCLRVLTNICPRGYRMWRYIRGRSVATYG